MKTFQKRLRNDLITGLILFLPVSVTLYFLFITLRWMINLLTFFSPLPEGPHPILPSLKVLTGLLILLMILILLGEITRIVVGRRIIELWEKGIEKIPLGGTLYKVLKQVAGALVLSKKQEFSRVVLAPFPGEGMFSIAFVTGESPSGPTDAGGQPLLSLFIPNTPNPTTGFYILMPRDKVVDLPIGVEEAFMLILSSGFAQPEKWRKNRE